MKQDKKKEANVPNLRFPGFEGEWEEKKLESIATFFSGGTPKTTVKKYYNGNIPFIRSGEINSDSTELYISKEGLKNSSAKLINKGDLLIALYGATSGEIAISKIRGAINQAILCVSTVQNKLFIQAVWLKYIDKILQNYLQGGQGNLSANIIKHLKFHFPNNDEQNKIATFISLLDKRISTQNKIIGQLETLIMGIYQKLADNKHWKKQYLRDILTERKETSKNNLPVFSVSVSKGVINQIEYLGRSFAAKNTANYNVVCFGDVVYTKSPTGEFPYGIIKQSFIRKNVVVSPLYAVYVPKDIHIGSILHYYFNSPINANNYLHSLIQKGAKNTINITNQRFLDNTIFLPTDKKEIEKIASLLNSINKKIQIEKLFLEQLEKQKTYLLQQIFV